MKTQRKSATETRALIVEAAVALMTEGGPESVSVASIMRRAGVSRTAFYRQFDSIYDVFAEILRDVQAELLAESGEWVTEPDAVGSPAVTHPNLLRFATSMAKHVDLLVSLHDACGFNPQLRELWQELLIRPFVDASEASISRDQTAGAVSADLDAASTALILTLLGEIASIELMGRQKISPEQYADIVAPIWVKVLFGVVPDQE